MLKFDQEKVNLIKAERIDSTDLQFLTFRNSAQSNNTGRTVFSHKIQPYKLLEKQNRQDQSELTPVRNFRKSPNLGSVRSQEKYIQAKPIQDLKKQQQKKDYSQQVNLELGENQYEFRNQLLRKKIQKLAKNIKNQQKRQLSLEKDILELEKDIQDDQTQIQSQLMEIKELQIINNQNQSYLEKLSLNFQEMENKNDHLQDLVDKMQDELHNVGKTRRQQDTKTKMALKLKQGLVKLEQLRTEVTNRCLKMEKQIQKMKQLLDQTQNLDGFIRDTAYTRQTQNNSHFTC